MDVADTSLENIPESPSLPVSSAFSSASDPSSPPVRRPAPRPDASATATAFRDWSTACKKQVVESLASLAVEERPTRRGALQAVLAELVVLLSALTHGHVSEMFVAERERRVAEAAATVREGRSERKDAPHGFGKDFFSAIRFDSPVMSPSAGSQEGSGRREAREARERERVRGSNALTVEAVLGQPGGGLEPLFGEWTRGAEDDDFLRVGTVLFYLLLWG